MTKPSQLEYEVSELTEEITDILFRVQEIESEFLRTWIRVRDKDLKRK